MSSRITEQTLETDILVAGGGPAGVCLALAAAHLGARVILCQDRPVLGGNASSEVRMHIVGATGLKGGAPLETELHEGGIIEEIRLNLAVQNPQRSPSVMDFVLYDKCRREPNLTLLLNTTVDGAEVVENVIRSATASRPSTERPDRSPGAFTVMASRPTPTSRGSVHTISRPHVSATRYRLELPPIIFSQVTPCLFNLFISH